MLQVISSIDEFQKFLAASNTALDMKIGSEQVCSLLWSQSYYIKGHFTPELISADLPQSA